LAVFKITGVSQSGDGCSNNQFKNVAPFSRGIIKSNIITSGPWSSASMRFASIDDDAAIASYPLRLKIICDNLNNEWSSSIINTFFFT
jgi:hypothetical protein